MSKTEIKRIRKRVNRVRSRLAKDDIPVRHAVAIAEEVFKLGMILTPEDARALADNFTSAIDRWGFQDILLRRIAYALRLAGSSGDLIYEEMHKLFSLLNEIYSLEQVGVAVELALREELNSAVRKRFAMQSSMASLVAEDRVEEWSKDLWWYADNLA